MQHRLRMVLGDVPVVVLDVFQGSDVGHDPPRQLTHLFGKAIERALLRRPMRLIT